MLACLSMGSAGNVNHLDVTRSGRQSGYDQAARIGTVLAAAVLKTYRKLEPLDVSALRGTRETVPLPPVELKPGDVEKARHIAAREQAGDKLTLIERVFAQRVFFAQRQEGRPFDV